MPTTPFGIWYPGSSDAVTPLETTFSTMASSIDNVLAGNVQIHRVDNITQRNALVSQFPPSATDPLVVWRADATNGQELEYTKNGTTWHYVSTSEDDTGWVSVTPAAGISPIPTGAAVRRIGHVVYYRGGFGAVSLTTSGTVVGTVAAEFRPVTSVDGSVSGIGLGSGAVARATVSSNGNITIIPPTNQTTGVYLKGLSGYLVN